MNGSAVTLLFTDIEGSTRMLERLGGRYEEVLEEHDRLMRAAIAGAGGREVRTAGDSFFAVFPGAGEAVRCAAEAQRMLGESEWPGGERMLVRMGLHTGAPTAVGEDFLGIDVHRAARVMSVAHGGQVLLTDEVRRALGSGVPVRDLGHHRLKDLSDPEHLFQLMIPGLREHFPAVRSLNRSNLPIPAHPLVGRQAEKATALEILFREDVSLVSLLGPGGTGKTRLAIELAAEASNRYPDGVWFVALASLADPGLVVAEVARVLEIDSTPGEALAQTLGRALAERELLLVLDNFEHLMTAAEALAGLLAAAPRLDLLVTSREALRIRGEHRFEVSPLSIEDASELFLQRAMAVRPDLRVGDEERAAIRRICKRLDGLPLALELAAARIAVFGPRALEARLAKRLVLSEGPRDLPARQRTLRAAIEWSYRLLEPAERLLLQQLAPFIGGVRVEDAEVVFQVTMPDAVQTMMSLSDKSLLRHRDDPDDEPRFWMLETIREFALECAVADGAIQTASDRHAEHFLAVTDQAAEHLVGPDQGSWLDRLERDQSNVRAALDHLTQHAPARALRMAGNLAWFWQIRGNPFEARRRLAKILACAPAESPRRGQALFAAAQVALQLGEAAEAEPLLDELASLARQEDEDRLLVLALSLLGWAAEALGDHCTSVARHEEAIAAARAAGDDWALGIALNNFAIVPAGRGDLQRARTLLGEALSIRRGIGEPRAIALTANNLADIILAMGDHQHAGLLVEEALARAREIDFRPLIGAALGARADISLMRGDLERARAQLHEALETTNAAYDLELASGLLSTAATLAAVQDEPTRAAALWSAADRARWRIHLGETPTSTRLRASWEPKARAAVSDPASWTAACLAGADLSLDDALALARGA